MKRLLVFVGLIFAVVSLAQAQSRSPKKQIERIAVKAGTTSDLSTLDRSRLIRGTVKIILEYSMYDIGQDQFEVRRFRSFKAVEQWLKSREIDGFPIRESREFWGCRKGRCIFDNVTQISHNRLYPQKILYGYRKKRPFIKAIYFLYG